MYDEKLTAINELFNKGVAPQSETVRSFLLWFGAARRGYRVTSKIRSVLHEYNLTTDPDFESVWIDGSIVFKKILNNKENDEKLRVIDPSYRVGMLAAANNSPVCVKPDDSIERATTIMLSNDFSQLPVMTGPRDVKGVISWKTIGTRMALTEVGNSVRQFMEAIKIGQVVEKSAPLFDVIERISGEDYCLVRARDGTIAGIVTQSDLSEKFLELSEPFLVIGEIERGVRQLLHAKFTQKELEDARNEHDDRLIESPSDLTFGEYIRLIEKPSRWNKIKIKLERVEFIDRLKKINSIRNDVMHFNPEGIELDDLLFLRRFADFLRRLRDVGAVVGG